MMIEIRHHTLKSQRLGSSQVSRLSSSITAVARAGSGGAEIRVTQRDKRAFRPRLDFSVWETAMTTLTAVAENCFSNIVPCDFKPLKPELGPEGQFHDTLTPYLLVRIRCSIGPLWWRFFRCTTHFRRSAWLYQLSSRVSVQRF